MNDCAWLLSSLGTAVLVLTTTEEDKTGASYYGEQSLQYVSTNGDSSMVQLGKERCSDTFISLLLLIHITHQ